KEMKLIESVTGDLPVMLLVEIPDRNRIRQNLVQILDALAAGLLAERDRQLDDRAERLDLHGLLPHQRPGPVQHLDLLRRSLRQRLALLPLILRHDPLSSGPGHEPALVNK